MNLKRIFGGAGTTAESVDTSAAGIQDWLMREVARELSVEISQLDPSVPLADYGLDSIRATTLSGTLGRHLGRNLSPVLIWDYPSIGALSRYLAGEPVERAGAGGEYWDRAPG
jgi:acyl carrier protein